MDLYIGLIVSAIISYLLGGLNGAIILSKIFYKQDIRDYGSKNPGFTNFKRVYGNSFIAWSVIIIDVLKTALPVFATAIFFKELFGLWQFGAAFSGLFCMIGHCFPLWYKFKGGKGFMAGFATIWFVDWRMAIAAVIVFFAVLFIWKYMSLASCSASFFCPIALLVIGPSSIWVEILCILSAALVIVRHKENLVKLAHGTESKFSLLDK